MKKHFYSHIFTIEKISVELDDLELSSEEKDELVKIAEKSVHHTVLDTILSALHPDDKKVFLSHLSDENHEAIWKLLHEKIEHPDWKIWQSIEKLLHELRKDIAEAKQKKNG